MTDRSGYFKDYHTKKKEDPIYVERRRLNSILAMRRKRGYSPLELFQRRLEKRFEALEPRIGYHLIELENLGL
jgi:hypothetical protein